MIPALLTSLLFGGSVYINGVKANSLRNFEIEDVDVHIDEQGDIYITAPNLIVEVAGQEESPAPEAGQGTAQPESPPSPQEPVVQPPATEAPAPQSSSPAGAGSDPAPGADASEELSPGVASALQAPPTTGVPPEAWWLIVEDNGSVGHVLEIKVNGQLVTNYQSGGAPVMIDLAPFLHPGENQVEVNALESANLAGGVLHVYVAPGENVDGVLTLAEPTLVFSRRSSDDPAGATFRRQLTLP